ncbi:hypothetical protein SLEP1_g11734 [Rubroshorea leprosula]|nr:hypothetical protein SLEP1_g11734 [Rubroshorea leprosula]
MDFFRELRELRGNQGREEEEEGVISVEPIVMIVPSALQDLLETLTPESNASLSAKDNGGDHHTSLSSSSSFEETPGRKEGTGDVVGNNPDLPVVGEWENRVLTGRLSNLCKAPKDLPVGFRFRVALHHEVADSVPSISGVIDGLDTSVRGSLGCRPAVSLARDNIRSAGGLRAGSDAADAEQHKVHHRLYAVVCEVGDTCEGDSVHVAVLMPAVSKLQRGALSESRVCWCDLGLFSSSMDFCTSRSCLSRFAFFLISSSLCLDELGSLFNFPLPLGLVGTIILLKAREFQVITTSADCASLFSKGISGSSGIRWARILPIAISRTLVLSSSLVVRAGSVDLSGRSCCELCGLRCLCLVPVGIWNCSG